VILKKSAHHQYVDLNGKVLQRFDGGLNRKGKINKYGKGGKPWCSSLYDLLWLVYRRVGSDDLRSAMAELGSHLEGFANPNEDPFAVVYRWRNSSLHGSTSIGLIGGTVLMLSLLVALDCAEREFDFDSMRKEADEFVEMTEEMRARTEGARMPWEYYPPEGRYDFLSKG
jgi:hypothetical protein